MADKIISIDDLQLDNTIKLVPATETEPEYYSANNGVVRSDFYQYENRVVYEFEGRQFVWKPQEMKYIDEFGEEDVIYTVTDVPLETKANYARFNRAMPDVDDWFIQENQQLKHQILIQGFQRDPFELLSGAIDFAIGGEITFDTDLKIIANGIEQTGDFETTGAVDFVDESGKAFFHLPEIVAYDSKIPERAMTGGKYRAINDGSGVMSFQIIVDNAWISSTERVYPLVIDPTVIVSAAYDTIGNNGRRIVRLSNNWLIACLVDTSTTYDDAKFYKSTDQGATWTFLTAILGTNDGGVNMGARVPSIAASGNKVYCIFGKGSDIAKLQFVKFDATTVGSSVNGSIVTIDDPSRTESDVSGGGNPTIAIDSSGNIHAAWADKVNTHPNSYNIFYSKSTDDGATWAASSMLTAHDNSGYHNKGASIVIKSDGEPAIAWYRVSPSTSNQILFQRHTGSGWFETSIESMSNEIFLYPSAIVKKNGSNAGRIVVAYQDDGTVVAKYSGDGGASWTSFTGLGVPGMAPTISENAAGDIFVFYQDGSAIDYKVCANGATSFGAATNIEASGAASPNAMERESATVIGVIYMDGSTVKYEKLTFNIAPVAPTNLIPTGGTIKDRNQIIQFTWQHNDSFMDTQSKFDLQYRLQGAGSWTTVTQTTPNQYYDMSASTLAAGAYEWQVRTYDQSNVASPYSSISAFNAATKTPTPTITAPTDGGTVVGASVTATWSSVAQTQYELKLLDAAGLVTLWTDTQTSASTSKTITYTLVNGASYKIQLRVMDSGGLWSDADINSINVSFTPPAKPSISLVKYDERGKVLVTATNPEPAGTVPALSNNEVYRRENGGDWVRIAASMEPLDITPVDIAPPSIMNNFVGKIAGSTVEIPHISKYAYSTTLTAPTGSWAGEFNAGYAQMATLNGTLAQTAVSTNLAIAQQLFSFNLTALIERGGFVIPSSDKVQWLKDNITELTTNLHGYGSGPSGNKAYAAYWDASAWLSTGSGYQTHTNGTVTKLTLISTAMTNRIDVNGFAHVITYSDPSNGTTASTINTDYIEIIVKFEYNAKRYTFTDYEPQPLANVEYYAQAIGANGTYAQSDTAAVTPNVAFTQISSLTDTTKYATLQKASTLQNNSVIESAKMKFAGRDFAMMEFGTGKESAFDYKYIVLTWSELQTIEELATSGETLLLRDNKGRKVYVGLDGVNVNEKGTHWEISIKPEKVYYVEGV